MSFTDRLILWLHIAFVIFTLGPVALAISSSPRYIRKRDAPILRFLARITAIFTIGSLGVLIFGAILGDLLSDFAHPWLTASMTLFLVTLVLLALIIKDQRRAIKAVEAASAYRVPPAAGTPGAGPEPPAGKDVPGGPQAATAMSAAVHVAAVERGRIAAMGGIVNLLWLVVLALMVWQP
jgi:hypothetical protein